MRKKPLSETEELEQAKADLRLTELALQGCPSDSEAAELLKASRAELRRRDRATPATRSE